MYTLEEMQSRIAHLRSVSPVKARKVLEELLAAITAYLTRDAGFELQVHKTLDKVIADTFHHGLKYEHEELLEPWREVVSARDAPVGYYDVTELFRGGEVFAEIMAVSDRDFRAAFYIGNSDSGHEDGSDEPQEKWRNRYVDDWIKRLSVAVTAELDGLKEIMQFCANRSYNVEWAIIFENLGAYTERHPVRHYAKLIYLTKGYGWLIETFNLRIYRPSYMAELPYWEDIVTNNPL